MSPGVVSGMTFPGDISAPRASGFMVSHPLTASQSAALLSEAKAQAKDVFLQSARRLREQKVKEADVVALQPPFDASTMVGWQSGGDRLLVYRFVGDNLIKWRGGRRNAQSILNARPRAVFEVPRETGLCLPYVFMPDDGKTARALSMSYRLKDHPDIQVTLTDASAFDPRDLFAFGAMSEQEVKHRNKQAEPEAEIAGFWHQALNAARKYESQWKLPSTTRSVTLAGYEGRQSFVQLTMDDGTRNHGYYAVVRGNPAAADDTPDLRLHVAQDVRLAQGKPPLTKEQLIEMAQAIAQSVERRPTVGQQSAGTCSGPACQVSVSRPLGMTWPPTDRQAGGEF